MIPRASCLPSSSTTYTGKIEVRYKDGGAKAGKARNWGLDTQGSGMNFLGPDEDLIIQFTKGPTDEAIEIIPTNIMGPSYPFFGAVASSNQPIKPGSDA